MRNLHWRLCAIDTRTLAALRIGLGSLMLFDLAKRAQGIGLWFVNEGFIPNHRVLFRPHSPFQLSYLFSLFTRSQVQTAFVVIALVYLAFLVGYRTRLFHTLSWFSLLSIHTRNDLVANGGDYVFCTLVLWTLFLPLGARFSVDALLAPPRATPARHASLAVLALRLQLCVIYLFNALNKSGETWHSGTAIHYVLYQTRIVTPLGVWFRENAPGEISRALTWGTIVIEYAAPLLIVWPWLGAWPRRLAIVLLFGLHIGIALLVNVGLFSPVMMVFVLSLLSAEDFDWLGSRPRIRDLLARWHERLRRVVQRYSLRQPAPHPPELPLTPLGERLATLRRWVSTAVVSVLLISAFSQLVVENPRQLGWLRHQRPRFMNAIVGYLRLNQGWGMFAPEAPRGDMWIVVDAQTYDRRRVDPFNELASDVADPTLRTVPDRLGQNYYFCDYTARITGESHFHDPLRDWIFDYSRRTHRDADAIRSFQAYVVEQDSPPFGERKPANVRSSVFLEGVREN